MTDQEINEAVARKLGWGESGEEGRWVLPSQGVKWLIDPPDFCHSIEAAWEVVESLHPQNGIALTQHLQPPYGWSCTMWTAMTEEPDFTVRADTAPMAICLVFLKLNE